MVAIEVKSGWEKDSAARNIAAELTANGSTQPVKDSGFFHRSTSTILIIFTTLLGGFAWTVRAVDGKDYDASLVGVNVVMDLPLVRID